MKCYVTFDVKTERYSVPVFFDNDEEAKRAYSFTINQMIGAPGSVDKSLLYFKKDIQLQCIGEYDQDSGCIVSCKTKTLGSLDSIYSDFKATYMTSLKEGISVSEINAKADEIINESIEKKDKSVVDDYEQRYHELNDVNTSFEEIWLSSSEEEKRKFLANNTMNPNPDSISDSAIKDMDKHCQEKIDRVNSQKKISLKRKKEEI